MRRNPIAQGFKLQDRDIEILRSLLDCRVATIYQLSRLHFDGRLDAARKRVQKLKSAGVVYERLRRSTDPSVYCLGKRSFQILQTNGLLAEQPKSIAYLRKRASVSDLTLRHELEVMDVRAAITAAARGNGFSINEFTTWPAMAQFEVNHRAGGRILVKPDGFIRIASGGFEQRFFLEVDRSTERQQILVERAACYQEYFLSGGFVIRHGLPRADYKRLPFVVLMTFKTAERRNNTAELLLRHTPPIRNQIWLTTAKEAMTDPLGAIWVKPADYARLTDRTAFDVNIRRRLTGYRRDPEREIFVEKRILKHCLLKQNARINPAD